MPSETTGFVYANLATAVPFVRTIAPLLGLTLPDLGTVDLGALKSLTAFGTRAGDESTFTVFLDIH